MTRAFRKRLSQTLIIMVRSFLFLLLLFVANSFIADAVHICDSKIQEDGLTATDFQKGLIVNIDKEVDDGMESDSGGAECDLPLARLVLTAGTVLEFSFSKNSRKDVENCVEVKYTGGFDPHDCSATNTSKKILTYESLQNFALATVASSVAILRDKLGVDSQVFIRHAPKTVQPVVKHVVGEVVFDCEYPNTFVVPSLHRTDINLDLTQIFPQNRGK